MKNVLILLAVFAFLCSSYAAESEPLPSGEGTSAVSANDIPAATPSDESVVKGQVKKAREKKVRPPRQHYGFYYSMGVGVSYLDFNYEESDDDDYQKSFFRFRAEDWSFPDLQFQFGRSFGNLFALYSDLELSLLHGKGKHIEVDYYRDYQESPWTSSEVRGYFESDNSTGILAYVGVGTTFYPFRNPNFFMNGSYISFSSGLMGMLLDIRENMDQENVVMNSIVSKLEIGKEWWVSDSWSLGVGFSYTFIDQVIVDCDHVDFNKFTIVLRLTRG